jgi:polar amino acid transport system substrate-binding protein
MKQVWNFVVLLLLLGSVSLFSQVKEIIFVSEDKENFPQQLGNGSEYNAVKPGAVIEFLKKIEPICNVKIKFPRMPWKNCLEDELKNNKADGAFLASYKKEREEFGVYPMKDGKPDVDKRVTTISYILVKKKGSSINWNGKQITGLTGIIGAPLGYSIVGDLTGMGYKVKEISNAELGMRQLASGKLDLFAGLVEQNDYVLQKNPDLDKSLEIITMPLVSKPYYLILSKQFVAKNPDLANKIWDTIKTLRDKEYRKITEKYYD